MTTPTMSQAPNTLPKTTSQEELNFLIDKELLPELSLRLSGKELWAEWLGKARKYPEKGMDALRAVLRPLKK